MPPRKKEETTTSQPNEPVDLKRQMREDPELGRFISKYPDYTMLACAIQYSILKELRKLNEK
jgi:hypothetical protein